MLCDRCHTHDAIVGLPRLCCDPLGHANVASTFRAEGYVTEACAGLRTHGRVQAGVGWVSPEAGYSNAMPPPFFWSRDHPNMVCGYVPWIPSLSQQGSVVFPP